MYVHILYMPKSTVYVCIPYITLPACWKHWWQLAGKISCSVQSSTLQELICDWRCSKHLLSMKMLCVTVHYRTELREHSHTNHLAPLAPAVLVSPKDGARPPHPFINCVVCFCILCKHPHTACLNFLVLLKSSPTFCVLLQCFHEAEPGQAWLFQF